MTLPKPWIFTIGPMVVPFDARQELSRLSDGLTTAEYVAKMWARRAEENPPLPRLKRRRMAFPLQVESKVVPMRKRKP